jgi:hypothetical protein
VPGSPRVTHDIDLAIKTTDADNMIDLMYESGYVLVTGPNKDSANIALSNASAKSWVTETKSGSLSFIGLNTAPEFYAAKLPATPLRAT